MKGSTRTALATIALGAAALAPAEAVAQSWEGTPGDADWVTPELSSDTLRPSVDARHTLVTDDARRGPATAARAHVQYISEPLVWYAEDGSEVALLSDVVGAQLTGSGAWGPARIGAVMPIYLLAVGDLAEPQGTALGDVGLHAKVSLLDPDRDGNTLLGVALVGGGTLPLGGSVHQLGHTGATWELGAVAQVSPSERAEVLLNLGTRGLPQLDLAEGSSDDAAWTRIAGVWRATPALAGTLELTGQAPWQGLTGNPEVFSLEALAGARWRTAEGRLLTGALGAGLTDGVGSPKLRIVLGVGQDHVPEG